MKYRHQTLQRALIYDPQLMNVIISLPTDNMTSMAQLFEDNERVAHKLNKVRLRRDHYARLYFQTLSELDEMKWKLGRAIDTIRELKKQGETPPQ